MPETAAFLESGFPVPRKAVPIVIGDLVLCLPSLLPGNCASTVPVQGALSRVGPELAGRPLRILGVVGANRSACLEVGRKDLNDGTGVGWPGVWFSNRVAFPGALIKYRSLWRAPIR